jgi:hypothetical protein
MRKIFFIILFMLVAAKSYSQEGDDPTQPLSAAEAADFEGVEMDNHGLYLNGIFSQSSGYTAMINGKVLHQGDSVEGYKIDAIAKDSVTLKSNSNDSIVLTFTNLNFKQPHQ